MLTRASCILLLASTFALIAFSGCATVPGNAALPEPTLGFEPKKTYAIPHEQMWGTVIQVLDGNRIGTVSLDNKNGRIVTDYVQGPSTVYFLGLGGVGNARYKYTVTIADVTGGETRVGILCKLESTLSGESGTTPWRDVSKDNAEIVTKLENWLYEQIEEGI